MAAIVVSEKSDFMAGHSPLLGPHRRWDFFPGPLLRFGLNDRADRPSFARAAEFMADPFRIRQFTDMVAAGTAAADQVMRSAYWFSRRKKSRNGTVIIGKHPKLSIEMALDHLSENSWGGESEWMTLADMHCAICGCWEADEALATLFGEDEDGFGVLLQVLRRLDLYARGPISACEMTFNSFHEFGCSVLHYVLNNISCEQRESRPTLNDLAKTFQVFPGAFDRNDVVQNGLDVECARAIDDAQRKQQATFNPNGTANGPEGKWLTPAIKKSDLRSLLKLGDGEHRVREFLRSLPAYAIYGTKGLYKATDKSVVLDLNALDSGRRQLLIIGLRLSSVPSESMDRLRLTTNAPKLIHPEQS